MFTTIKIDKQKTPKAKFATPGCGWVGKERYY